MALPVGQVPVGAIYGFIGENNSGRPITEKLICGHLVPDGGEAKLFGKDYTDAGVQVRVGALIENTGCFPNSSVWNNLMMQAIDLGLEHPADEINWVLQIVCMEDSAKTIFKSCSLGMKQRIGIAMAPLGNPAMLMISAPATRKSVYRPGQRRRLCDLQGLGVLCGRCSDDPRFLCGGDAWWAELCSASDLALSATKY